MFFDGDTPTEIAGGRGLKPESDMQRTVRFWGPDLQAGPYDTMPFHPRNEMPDHRPMFVRSQTRAGGHVSCLALVVHSGAFGRRCVVECKEEVRD